MEKNFSLTPTVAISRSKFLRRSQHKTSLNLGDIVPIYVDEVLPGDTRNLDIASLIRMSTPIAPIMDDIVMEYMAFFVPNRIVWSHWKEFMGEKDVAGYVGATDYVLPKDEIYLNNMTSTTSILQYMGIPRTQNACKVAINALPLRAYYAIYNRWFRNQNVEGPLGFPTGDYGVGGTGSPAYVKQDGTSVSTANDLGNLPCLVAYKKADYFTSALPYAQKGTPVALPLGTFAPIITRSVDVDKWFPSSSNIGSTYVEDNGMRFYMIPGGQASTAISKITGAAAELGYANGQGSGPSYMTWNDTGPTMEDQDAVVPANLWADLSNATAATINDIRLAFATQKALEKDALYGTRYWEVLYGHFGVKSPDASLQDPEYLGGHKFYINVDQVLQTTGYDNSSTSELGAVGANSVTGSKASLFTKSFVEHGHIIVVAVARQKQHTYCNGINRMWNRSKRFDFYFPVFANLGNQDILNQELFIESGVSGVFGYQEAWSEYRYKPSISTGLLSPNAPSSFDYWTLTDKFASSPTLSKSFLLENRANLARCLVSSTGGPDFICDFLFNDIAVRPMPMYSIPGLIDHH